jgi:O-antigen/teichoic acid export membrane protein
MQKVAFIGIGALSQIFSIAFNLLYAKLFAPEAIGTFALFLATIALLQCVLTFRYDGAIVLEKTSAGALRLAGLALTISFAMTILILFGYVILLYISSHMFSVLELLAIIILPLIALQQTVYSILLRANMLRIISFNKFLSVVAIGSFSTLFQVAGFPNSLIAGWLLGSILSIFRIVIVTRKYNQRYLPKLTDSVKLTYLFYKYKSFPLYELPMTLVDAGKSFLLNYLVVSYFGAAANGAYYLASKIVQAPVLFFSSSYGQIFFRNIAELVNSNKATRPYVLKTIQWSTLLAIFCYLTIDTVGVKVLQIIVGDKWSLIFLLIPILSVWYAIYFVGTNISGLSPATRMQRGFVMPSMLSNIAMLLPLFIVGMFHGGIIFAVTLQSLFATLSIAYMILWLYRNCTVPDSNSSGLSYQKSNETLI